MKKHIAFFLTSISFLSWIASATPTLSLVSPSEGEVVPLLSVKQKSYLDMPREQRIASFADPEYRQTMKSWGYYPEKVRLSWSFTDDVAAHTKFTVQVFRKPDNVPVFLTDTVKNEVLIDNLEIAREYGWMVIAQSMGDVRAVQMGSFRTEDRAPRLLRIPGVPNVRDLGGRIGLNGRRVRQGLVIRTAGLNENASTLYYTPEETEELLDAFGIREKKEALEKSLAEARALRDSATPEQMVKVPVASTWTVFRPKGEDFKALGVNALGALKEVPKTFLGAPAETAKMDAKGVFEFPKEDCLAAFSSDTFKHPAVFMQVIEAERDGWFGIGCAADWYWELRLDGEVVFERMQGNEKAEKSTDDWRFPIRVRKGRHVLSAVVYSGSVAWAWACEAKPNVLPEELFQTKVDMQKRSLEKLTRIPKGTQFGQTRLVSATRDYMLHTLGMQSDIDLRSDGECYGMRGSPMGSTVNWFHISSAAYAGLQEDWGREAFTEVFKVFLNPANYPIDFHCIAGQDRTGAVAFIINGLLGVPEEELYLDWESTGFWNPDTWFSHKNLFNHLVAGFEKWPGATLCERLEAYVYSLGFTAEDVAKLREILLEPAPAK